MILRNKNTGAIGEFLNHQGNDWEIMSEAEVNNYLLDNAKAEKRYRLKNIRDAYMTSDYVSHKAIELYKDEDGDWVEGSEVYFAFNSKSTGNAATEPNSVIFATILNSLTNPSYSLRYSCHITEGESKRKGYVKMTASVAAQLAIHATNRTTETISLANEIEAEINNAATLDELESINIDFTS